MTSETWSEVDQQAWMEARELAFRVADAAILRAQTAVDDTTRRALAVGGEMIETPHFPPVGGGVPHVPQWIGAGIEARGQQLQQMKSALEVTQSGVDEAQAAGQVIMLADNIRRSLVNQYDQPYNVEQDLVTYQRLRGYTDALQDLQSVFFERNQRAAAEAAQRAEAAAASSVVAASHAQEAASDTGAAHLGEHFEAFAKEERRRGHKFMIAMGVSVAVAVGVAVTVLAKEADAPTTSVAVTRVSVAIPVLLAAIYFAKIGSRHSRAAQHASELAARLRTLRAYTSGLPEGAAIQTRFGRQVFDVELIDTAAPEELSVASSLMPQRRRVRRAKPDQASQAPAPDGTTP